ncbi:arginine/serine-rich protein PNISR-like [Chelonus insularis]|uniref:arginine/serine-rich protein PNISR-like n=1 Tax=Chelonus insularis TaxID=460826 RepID=UPI00158BCA23|nr:arginine/serine-rich protein PNISR-like [Chelonus insularis]XP_034949131.1 arginine/serine-rich protein PNISR-like [Chelonus insularis]
MKMNREMFDDKDYPTQWALNPSMYQNMSNDQVDWAALAQQWIKMKETVVPPAPPPPSLSNDTRDGGGEAPMDMDTKDDDVPPAPPAPNISGNDNWSQWSQWGQWNTSAPGGGVWEWSGVPPPGVTMGPDGKPMGVPSVPAVSTMPVVPPAPNISARPGFNVPPPTAPYTYNSITSNAATFNQVPGYWSSDPTAAIASPTTSPFIKGMRHSPRMPHMRNEPLRPRDEKEKTPEDDTNMVIDAAKRRQLPAWIREGLEKMEREKHKAVERERQEMLRKQELEARKLAEDEARAVLDPAKSKFDSDSEKDAEADYEDKEQENDRLNPENSPEIIVKPRKSRFRDADSSDSRIQSNESSITSGSITGTSIKRTREEVLQDVMLKVRRSLTEILLEVTNEEIASVCREVWNRYRAKAPAGEPPVASFTNTAPLAQITRTLGLGIYGDSNSESEEEQESQQTDENDSDLELKETLRRRQAAFKKTEEEIEARLAEEEENELREDEYNSGKYETHSGNDNSKTPGSIIDGKEMNNEREASEAPSSGGHTPKHQNQTIENPRTNQSSPSRSIDTESSSNGSTTSASSDFESSDSSRATKKRKRKKSRSRSRSRTRKSRSDSRSRDKRSRRKSYRSRSSSRKSGKKRSRDRKRHSRSSTRSRSRRRSRSHSRRSRDRKRSRSRSRNRKRSSRSYSRERRRSRSYGHSSSKRRSRSKSKERSRRSRSKSRTHRDGKKSAHRYRD